MNMANAPYIIELLTPRADQEERREQLLDRFTTRFQRVRASGCAISVPDNPMGKRRMSIIECLERRGITVDPERFIMNLNTFHTKSELDEILHKASALSISNILVIRGDGGPDLPRLEPETIGGTYNIATSFDLIRYISETYPTQFKLGAAFNPYNRMDFELKKMEQKIRSGASFAVTQPITGKDESVDALFSHDIDVVVEAWMSNNIDLLFRSVGKEVDEQHRHYEPYRCVDTLHHHYPDSCMYLAMLDFEEDWEQLLPRITR